MSKAKLLLILKAGEAVVEEVEDPILWQKVLASIQSGQKLVGEIENKPAFSNIEESIDTDTDTDISSVVEKLSKNIGVTANEVKGAIDPQKEHPFITISNKYWEAMKKNTPPRGPGALGPAAVVGTILALWFDAAKINESVTQSIILKVLNNLNVSDNNPARSIKNTDWLIHRRGGIVKIDPSQISDAESFVRNFCTKTWSKNSK